MRSNTGTPLRVPLSLHRFGDPGEGIALRLARKKVLIVDIWPGFEPSPMMLSGEPFVLDYLANIEADVVASHDSAGWDLSTIDVVPEHVRMWRFDVLDWGI